ncbi:TcaA NTF2-like domain-containing protein [Staphylococcus aureus]|uniref:TcaA NTF2-like domain-containing protein n=1 Tax=Staphylococcus aureus TaxID=1280 RepID=UPI000A62ACBE
MVSYIFLLCNRTKEFNNTAHYKYKHGNAKEVIAESNQTTELGKFFIGKYSIKTDKTIEDSIHNGTLTGKIFIDLGNRGNNNKIYADEDFNQSWFKVKLNDYSLLEKNSYKIIIDDKDVDYNSKKTYGKYYNPTELSVYAIGKLEGKEFKTNRINIRRNYDNKPQNLKLNFKKSQITEYENKSKKVKEKSKSYIKEYTKQLNKAYKKKDYKYISDYVKSNSQLEKQLKKQVKSKSKVKFKDVKINSIKRDKNKVYIELSKTNNNNVVQTKYTLDYDNVSNEFLVEDSQDN